MLSDVYDIYDIQTDKSNLSPTHQKFAVYQKYGYIVQFQMFNYIAILKGHRIHHIHHIVIS
jgi:hypothetical protein